jgi:hypothetical protein
MRKRIKSSSGHDGRKRDHIAWIIAAVLLFYLIFAQRPLSQGRTFTALGSSPPDSLASIPPPDDDTFHANDRVFMFRPDQQGVTEMDASGKALWTHEFGTLVTTASVGSHISAWALMDGSVQILDEAGLLLEDLKIDTKGVDSTYPCVYGVAISETGEYLAALYGRDPQYFAVFVRNIQTHDLLYFQRLKQQVVSRQAASFSVDGGSVLLQTADGLALFDIEKKRSAMIHPNSFSGDTELQILPFGPQSFAFLLAKDRERFAGSIRKGSLEAFFPVESGSRELSISGDIMTIQGGTSMQRYRLGLH